ncbi:MAG: hypothetical protein GY830_01570 [Bacteroidetes bacterium]|nr:hypothetical protein [Bacteroidota bacterium]
MKTLKNILYTLLSITIFITCSNLQNSTNNIRKSRYKHFALVNSSERENLIQNTNLAKSDFKEKNRASKIWAWLRSFVTKEGLDDKYYVKINENLKYNHLLDNSKPKEIKDQSGISTHNEQKKSIKILNTNSFEDYNNAHLNKQYFSHKRRKKQKPIAKFNKRYSVLIKYFKELKASDLLSKITQTIKDPNVTKENKNYLFETLCKAQDDINLFLDTKKKLNNMNSNSEEYSELLKICHTTMRSAVECIFMEETSNIIRVLNEIRNKTYQEEIEKKKQELKKIREEQEKENEKKLHVKNELDKYRKEEYDKNYLEEYNIEALIKKIKTIEEVQKKGEYKTIPKNFFGKVINNSLDFVTEYDLNNSQEISEIKNKTFDEIYEDLMESYCDDDDEDREEAEAQIKGLLELAKIYYYNELKRRSHNSDEKQNKIEIPSIDGSPEIIKFLLENQQMKTEVPLQIELMSYASNIVFTKKNEEIIQKSIVSLIKTFINETITNNKDIDKVAAQIISMIKEKEKVNFHMEITYILQNNNLVGKQLKNVPQISKYIYGTYKTITEAFDGTNLSIENHIENQKKSSEEKNEYFKQLLRIFLSEQDKINDRASLQELFRTLASEDDCMPPKISILQDMITKNIFKSKSQNLESITFKQIVFNALNDTYLSRPGFQGLFIRNKIEEIIKEDRNTYQLDNAGYQYADKKLSLNAHLEGIYNNTVLHKLGLTNKQFDDCITQNIKASGAENDGIEGFDFEDYFKTINGIMAIIKDDQENLVPLKHILQYIKEKGTEIKGDKKNGIKRKKADGKIVTEYMKFLYDQEILDDSMYLKKQYAENENNLTDYYDNFNDEALKLINSKIFDN